MFGRAPTQAWLLTLVCVALLFARIGGVHLHLCFDGSEPPASLHFEDSGHHADHHLADAHNDRDVSLLADALTKTGKLSLDFPLLLAAFCLSLLLCALRPVYRPHQARTLWPPPDFLRPFLRGPPDIAS